MVMEFSHLIIYYCTHSFKQRTHSLFITEVDCNNRKLYFFFKKKNDAEDYYLGVMLVFMNVGS